jgi:Family of unknown function (DUF6492)
MDWIVFYLLSNQRLPFIKRRQTVLREYLRYKKWQMNPNSVPIEVVVPCIERDMVTLPLLVQSIHKFLLHPIQQIHIVGPRKSPLQQFCKDHNCNFVDENHVLPICLNDIGEYYTGGYDRKGWIFQQLLKLGADSFVQTQYYYVLDADTVLISPQTVLRNDKLILNTSDEFHEPYRLVYEKLLGEKPLSPVSFVSHQMLFERETLLCLKRKIESHTGKFWYQAIIDLVDRNEASSFSEYELYGNFLTRYYLKNTSLEYFFNIALDRKSLSEFPEIEKSYASKYKSASFHWYGIG